MIYRITEFTIRKVKSYYVNIDVIRLNNGDDIYKE